MVINFLCNFFPAILHLLWPVSFHPGAFVFINFTLDVFYLSKKPKKIVVFCRLTICKVYGLFVHTLKLISWLLRAECYHQKYGINYWRDDVNHSCVDRGRANFKMSTFSHININIFGIIVKLEIFFQWTSRICVWRGSSIL